MNGAPASAYKHPCRCFSVLGQFIPVYQRLESYDSLA